jgi:hypothetical protein
MSGVMTLVRHSLHRWRGFFGATAIVLIAVQFFMILAARSLELSGRFRLVEAVMPAFMAQWTNMMAASFAGFVLFGYSHPLVQLFLVATAIGVGSEPAAEIDTKFIDLLMARPLPRSAAVNRTLVMLVLVAAGAIVCMVGATWGGLRLLAPASARLPHARVVASLAANLAFLVLAWGGVALALASPLDGRSGVRPAGIGDVRARLRRPVLGCRHPPGPSLPLSLLRSVRDDWWAAPSRNRSGDALRHIPRRGSDGQRGLRPARSLEWRV